MANESAFKAVPERQGHCMYDRSSLVPEQVGVKALRLAVARKHKHV